jgi:hypothetical protein
MSAKIPRTTDLRASRLAVMPSCIFSGLRFGEPDCSATSTIGLLQIDGISVPSKLKTR